ncbi:fatty acid alpha-hydroxylase [Mortierella claussenii]|nr:fatty acid alpha-hydroxylase [Mortierella claussenii]
MDHPGGEEFVLDHAGQDISLIMKDELSHFHSEGAYEMLNEFLIGTVEHQNRTAATTTSVSLENSKMHHRSTATATVAIKPAAATAVAAATNTATATAVTGAQETLDDASYFKPTDLAADKKTQFLDLSQPLLWQLWNSNYSKAFYLEQVHTPRHLSGPARIFGSPFLEVFTKTPWFVIPIVWLPVVAFLFQKSLEGGLLAKDQSATLFLVGITVWTLAEYIIHRFLFHLDDRMPDSNVSLVVHFLLHGIHHYLPMDRMRLVMPPVLAVILAIPINRLAHLALPAPHAYAVMSGLIFGYVLYDLMHYYLHHARVFKIHFKEMKTHHLAHHYKNFEGGYGITSKIWDRVFNTELQL